MGGLQTTAAQGNAASFAYRDVKDLLWNDHQTAVFTNPVKLYKSPSTDCCYAVSKHSVLCITRRHVYFVPGSEEHLVLQGRAGPRAVPPPVPRADAHSAPGQPNMMSEVVMPLISATVRRCCDGSLLPRPHHGRCGCRRPRSRQSGRYHRASRSRYCRDLTSPDAGPGTR